jgi:uncharacterized membrane protein YeaQ/YmgE (transglycosylase-associated protein family)
MVLGIIGAIVGGFVFGLITGGDMVTGINVTSIVVAAAGALILLVGYHAVTGRRTA